jgi:hypothetical protein
MPPGPRCCPTLVTRLARTVDVPMVALAERDHHLLAPSLIAEQRTTATP